MHLEKIDGRTRLAKRTRELQQTFVTALGAAASSPIMQFRVRTAAELAMAAERERSRFLAGDPSVSAGTLAQIEREAATAIAALGIADQVAA